ncbi:DNA polymerase Y family protein [Streptomyces sp. CAU 1734]|uniref:DNA polymerase Y family protein n=1 Tax=Streptomyces sp. CAU 1734 TaxID=3140360 RepID=UPI0032617741
MGRVLALWVPDWPVVAASVPAGVPVAVVAAGAVLACSDVARTAGVRRGMRLRVAQARCPQLKVVDRDIEAETAAFEPLVRRLESDVLARLEIIRPGLFAAPARGPARYWGGEPQLAERLRSAAADSGHARVGIGFADTVFAAALAARTSRNIPEGQTAVFLAPYPVGILGLPRLTELLQRLGLPTVGAFARLPVERVAARFGAPAAAAHRTARGLEARPLTARTDTGQYTVEQAFDPPETRIEPLTFAAKALADQLHEQLTGAAVVGARLEVTAHLAHTEQTLVRAFRHEGRLSALAVADRVRGLVTAWARDGVLGAGESGGIARLVLRPDGLGPATGRQQGLFGETLTPEEVERAAARVQALLGHTAVTRVELGGGRGPRERARRIPYGDHDTRRPLPEGPWPGRLPAPHPATVFPLPPPAELTDAHGVRVEVSARLELSAPPAVLLVDGHGRAPVVGWAGPWPVLERWWEPEPAQARRIARMQITCDDGRAWLLIVEHGRWTAEALYG